MIQLRIQLRDIEPTVWRRLLVPGGVRLGKLHDVFQAGMGWEDRHLHIFRIGEATYGSQIDDYPEDQLDEQSVTVIGMLRPQRRIVYEYDFGDSWQHDVVVEDILTTGLGLQFAVCVDGQNACPPEDCGGVSGYDHMLRVLVDPTDEDHEHYRGWLGGSFDPTAFSPAETNVSLQRLR